MLTFGTFSTILLLGKSSASFNTVKLAKDALVRNSDMPEPCAVNAAWIGIIFGKLLVFFLRRI
jgi:hypothetical protein